MEGCKAIWEVRAGLSAETAADTVLSQLDGILAQAADDADLRRRVEALVLTWPRGLALPEHTRRWAYASSQYEQDLELRGRDPDAETQFERLDQEARQYAEQLRDPRHLNWVRLDWLRL
jgi:hypothetical protein